MSILKNILKLFIFMILTLLTQIGGILYLLSEITHTFFSKQFHSQAFQYLVRLTYFLLLYLIATFAVVPEIAEAWGRVPLPLSETTI